MSTWTTTSTSTSASPIGLSQTRSGATVEISDNGIMFTRPDGTKAKVPMRPTVTMKDLQSEAYQMDAAQLRAAWIARFGSDWVSSADFANDELFLKVHNRLGALGEMEEAYVQDKWEVFVRIKN